MGADGGVVYIPLRAPGKEAWERAIALLRPFWQFLSTDGGAYWAENANAEWERKNPKVGPPDYLLGYYGTDRGDNFDLGDLPVLCDPFKDWRGDLYALTFEELDLDVRTRPFMEGRYNRHPLHRLWLEHFEYRSREEVLAALGPLAKMTVRERRAAHASAP
jgi:hypothetical protein